MWREGGDSGPDTYVPPVHGSSRPPRDGVPKTRSRTPVKGSDWDHRVPGHTPVVSGVGWDPFPRQYRGHTGSPGGTTDSNRPGVSPKTTGELLPSVYLPPPPPGKVEGPGINGERDRTWFYGNLSLSVPRFPLTALDSPRPGDSDECFLTCKREPLLSRPWVFI